MIEWEEALENPELMIKYKDMFKNTKIFDPPWYEVFEEHPYLYREFSDRFDEMSGWDLACALREDPTLISDLKEYLHKMDGWGVARALRGGPTLVLDLKNHLYKMNIWDIDWLLRGCPELSLCIKYRGSLNGVEVAYYITFPHKLGDLDKEEKRKMSKRIMEILKREKI